VRSLDCALSETVHPLTSGAPKPVSPSTYKGQRFIHTTAPAKDAPEVPDFRSYQASSDTTNRALSYAMVGAMGVLSASVAKSTVAEFLGTMSASADVLALAKVEVELGSIPEGKNVIIKWRGKPVFIRHRTSDEIQEARSVDWKTFRDPQSDEQRTKKPEWLVMLGVCTHLGCVPIGEAGDFGGWFCPCHGSHYDISGRARKGPAPVCTLTTVALRSCADIVPPSLTLRSQSTRSMKRMASLLSVKYCSLFVALLDTTASCRSLRVPELNDNAGRNTARGWRTVLENTWSESLSPTFHSASRHLNCNSLLVNRFLLTLYSAKLQMQGLGANTTEIRFSPCLVAHLFLDEPMWMGRSQKNRLQFCVPVRRHERMPNFIVRAKTYQLPSHNTDLFINDQHFSPLGREFYRITYHCPMMNGM
jgi:ubiquinol-cytochrome c reductase iron-sulfur subunit